MAVRLNALYMSRGCLQRVSQAEVGNRHTGQGKEKLMGMQGLDVVPLYALEWSRCIPARSGMFEGVCLGVDLFGGMCFDWLLVSCGRTGARNTCRRGR